MKSGLYFAGIIAVFASPVSAQAKEPRSVDYSAASVSEIAGCIALKLSESRGYEVSKSQTATGLDMKLRFRVVGVAATAATYLIDDLGDRRRLTIFATGKTSGAPRVISEGVRVCATKPAGS